LPSDTVHADILGAMPINIIKDMVSIYPNPIGDKLFIESKDALKSVSLYNSSGTEVDNWQINGDHSVMLSMQNKSSGIYFMKIVSLKGFSEHRLLIR